MAANQQFSGPSSSPTFPVLEQHAGASCFQRTANLSVAEVSFCFAAFDIRPTLSLESVDVGNVGIKSRQQRNELIIQERKMKK